MSRPNPQAQSASSGFSNDRCGNFGHWVLIVVLFVMPLAATGDTEPMPPECEHDTFEIPQQQADKALMQFAEQAGVTFLFPLEVAQSVQANPLYGCYPKEEAVARLLRDTGLEFRFGKGGVISVTASGQEEDPMMEKRRGGILAGLLSALLGGGMSTAGAQDTQDSAAASDGRLVLEEVRVTAQRREQSLQDVPISITAFTSEAIEKYNLSGSADYLKFTPNVNFTEDGEGGRRGLTLAIRGVSNVTDNEISTTNSFGFYVDELNVAAAANIVVNPRLNDVERVEVLRGPQGTLFGRNASGGAFNITTKKPNEELYGEVSVIAQSFGTFGGSAILNVPLSDRVFARAVLDYEQGDGYVENVTPSGSDRPDFDSFHFRGAVRFLATDDLTLDLSYDRTEENQDLEDNLASGVLALSSLSQLRIPCTPAQNAAKQCALDPAGIGFFPDNDEFVARDYPEINDNTNDTVNLRVTWMGEKVMFKSITGYMESSSTHNFDLDGTPLSQIFRNKDRDAESFSQEVRLHSNNWESVNWVVGALYAKDEFSAFRKAMSGDLGFGPFLPNNLLNQASDDFENESWAVFADATWSLTPALDLTAGVRYTEDDITVGLSRRAQGNRRPASGSVPLPDLETNETFDDFSYRVALNFFPAEDTMLYGLISTGYKAGGAQLNSAFGSIPENSPYDEEHVVNYEAGFKSTFFDKRFRLNFAAFLIDWDDLQVETQVFDPETLEAIVLVQNAARAENKGFELEFEALLTEALSIGGGFGYLDSKFKDFDNAIVANNVLDLTDYRVPQTPEWTVNLFGEYRTPLSDRMQAWGRVEYTYRDETRTNLEAVAQPILGLPDFPYRVPSFEVVNLRAGIDADLWSVVAYVQNLTDENYYTGIREDFGFSGIKLRPHFREYGIKLTRRFQ